MNLGTAIRMCRTRRGLSQKELASRAQCSLSYLSLIENDQRDPTLSVVKNIAIGLKVPLNILFFLAAAKDELIGIDQDLAGQLARVALDFLNEETSTQQNLL